MSTLIEYFKQVGGFEQNVEEEEEGSAREQNDSFPHSSYIHPTNENVNTNHKTILLVAFDFDADRECRRLLSSSSSSSSSSSLSSSSCLHPITITKSSSSSLSSPSFFFFFFFFVFLVDSLPALYEFVVFVSPLRERGSRRRRREALCVTGTRKGKRVIGRDGNWVFVSMQCSFLGLHYHIPATKCTFLTPMNIHTHEYTHAHEPTYTCTCTHTHICLYFIVVMHICACV